MRSPTNDAANCSVALERWKIESVISVKVARPPLSSTKSKVSCTSDESEIKLAGRCMRTIVIVDRKFQKAGNSVIGEGGVSTRSGSDWVKLAGKSRLKRLLPG